MNLLHELAQRNSTVQTFSLARDTIMQPLLSVSAMWRYLYPTNAINHKRNLNMTHAVSIWRWITNTHADVQNWRPKIPKFTTWILICAASTKDIEIVTVRYRYIKRCKLILKYPKITQRKYIGKSTFKHKENIAHETQHTVARPNAIPWNLHQQFSKLAER